MKLLKLYGASIIIAALGRWLTDIMSGIVPVMYSNDISYIGGAFVTAVIICCFILFHPNMAKKKDKEDVSN